MDYLGTTLLVIGALHGLDKAKPAREPAPFLAVSVALEKAGWTWPQKDLLRSERDLKVADTVRGKLPNGQKVDRVRYVWVMIDGPIDCPFGKEVRRGWRSGPGDEHTFVFKLQGGKSEFVSFEDKPIEVTVGRGFQYVSTIKAGEKLYILHLRVDLLEGNRVVRSGYTGSHAFVVFRKAP